MEIRWLEIANFGQFYGKQKVEFCGYNGRERHRVTVIYGGNGGNVMDVYHAWLFCIYGKIICYSRDHKVEAEAGGLINSFALEEDARRECNGVDTYVRACFAYRGQIYEMQRGISGMLNEGGSITTQTEALKLTITSIHGAQSRVIVERTQIAQIINELLPERLQQYFMFEKRYLEKLAAVTARKKKLALSMRNLLDMEAIITAAQAVGILENKLASEMTIKSGEDMPQNIREKPADLLRIQELTRRQTRLREALRRDNLQIEQVAAEMAAYERRRQLLQERSELEKGLQHLNRQQEESVSMLRLFLPVAASLPARDLLADIYQDIDEKRTRGFISPESKRELVEKILTERTCICGRPVAFNSSEQKYLEQWLAAEGEVLSAEVEEAFASIRNTINFLQGKLGEFFGLLQQVSSVNAEVHSVKSAMTLIDAQLSDLPNRDDAARIFSRHAGLQREIQEKERELTQISADLRQAECFAAHLVGQIEQLDEHAALRNKHSVLVQTRLILETIIAHESKELCGSLAQRATDYLRNMPWIERDGHLKKITLGEDYAMEVWDEREKPVFKLLGPAMRKSVVMALMSAIAEIAGGSEDLNMPVFMDFFFRSLPEEEQREQAEAYVLNGTSQLILLLNREAFGTTDGELLTKTQQWGGFYILKAERTNVANLQPWPVAHYQQVLVNG